MYRIDLYIHLTENTKHPTTHRPTIPQSHTSHHIFHCHFYLLSFFPFPFPSQLEEQKEAERIVEEQKKLKERYVVKQLQ